MIIGIVCTHQNSYSIYKRNNYISDDGSSEEEINDNSEGDSDETGVSDDVSGATGSSDGVSGMIGDSDSGRNSDGDRMDATGGSVSSGTTSNLAGKEPVEVFEQIFTPDIVNTIHNETNRYGQQYIDSHQDHLQSHPRARAHDFIKCPFSLNEIYRYNDVCINVCT